MNVSLCMFKTKTINENNTSENWWLFQHSLTINRCCVLNVYSFHWDSDHNYIADVSFMLNSRLIYIFSGKIGNPPDIFFLFASTFFCFMLDIEVFFSKESRLFDSSQLSWLLFFFFSTLILLLLRFLLFFLLMNLCSTDT